MIFKPFEYRLVRQLTAAVLFLFFAGYGSLGIMPHPAVAGVVCSNCLTADKSVYVVGDKLNVYLKNMAPNTPIFLTLQVNSNVLFTHEEFEKTDVSGNYTFNSGTITEDFVGVWNLTAEAGNQQASLSLTINPAPGDTKPAISYISKYQASQGETITFYIGGKNFNGAEGISGNGISPVSDRGFQLVSSKLLSPFEIQATYSIASNAAIGPRSITVTTPAGTTAAQEFSVMPPAPVITTVTPVEGPFGTKLEISGLHFTAIEPFINFYFAGQSPLIFSSAATRISETKLEYILPTTYIDLRPGSYDITVSVHGQSGFYYFLESNKVQFKITGAPIDPPPQPLPPLVILPVNSRDGEILQFNSEPTLYLVKPDGLYPFESFYVFQLYAGQNNKTVRKVAAPSANFTISYITAAQYLNLATGDGQPFVPGTLVNYKGTIFLIMVGKQIPFNNFKAFQGLGYSLNNVINADLPSYNLTHTAGIRSADVPHTWGSWINYNGTIYYSDESGLIGVPSYDIFLSNRGMLRLVVPANKYDIEVLNRDLHLPVLDYNDPRVEYNDAPPPVLPASQEAAARDAKRVADVRQMQSAFELYYNDFGKYPASLSQLSPTYFNQLPMPPTPSDGFCNAENNSYSYGQEDNGASYHIYFCLGADAGSLKSGMRRASPYGIN